MFLQLQHAILILKYHSCVTQFFNLRAIPLCHNLIIVSYPCIYKILTSFPFLMVVEILLLSATHILLTNDYLRGNFDHATPLRKSILIFQTMHFPTFTRPFHMSTYFTSSLFTQTTYSPWSPYTLFLCSSEIKLWAGLRNACPCFTFTYMCLFISPLLWLSLNFFFLKLLTQLLPFHGIFSTLLFPLPHGQLHITVLAT